MKGEIQFWGHTHTLNICPSRAASSQLKIQVHFVIVSMLIQFLNSSLLYSYLNILCIILNK